MKNLYLLMAGLLLAVVFPAYAQISQGGMPQSQMRSLSLEGVPTVQLPAFNLEAIMAEDAEDEKAGNFPKIGRVRPVDISPENSGLWMDLQDGGRLWRAAVKSRDALGLSVQFEDFNLPEGASLFIYSPDRSFTIGAFTSYNNHETGIFSTQLIPSDEVIVEYYEPSPSAATPFRISGVVHAYRMVPGARSASRDFGDSDSCEINVNCSEGDDWQDEKRGVARILVFEGGSAGWCTGSLVNNTAEDCTPYFLTALHCGVNATTANFNQWIFYFNYEFAGCSNGSSGSVPNNTMTGCAKIADSGDNGGDTGSDYLLVELNNAVPDSYNVYYNGWRRNNVTSSSGVSIHHPAGDVKKISTYSSNLQSVSWGGSVANTHWLVQWSSTANGQGVTEGGSSGSPIFDNQGYIIGTLTGGSSFCATPNSPDLYGKMSYHWSSNPGDDISDFLDPAGTGAVSLTGTYAPCGSGSEDCAADIPYPETDPCVVTVITANPSCCEVAWNTACQTAYDACNDPGEDCSAGTINVSTEQDICPEETGIFDVVGANVPAGGGFAVQFVPDGGTGGNGTGFSISGVDLPYEFDAGINGVMAANGFPPLEGQWVATGFAYTDPENPAASFCDINETDVVLNFLSEEDADCNETEDCVAEIPYPMDDPCVITVIDEDPFCCDTEWDDICEEAYEACAGAEPVCNAGEPDVASPQDICPDEMGVFNATGVEVPEGGGYAVQFLPDGGTGGNEVGFSITGVELPFEFDAGINGVMEANSLPPLEGQWVLTGFAYTDPENAGASACSIGETDIIVNFLSEEDAACNETEDCVAEIPYPMEDPCVITVIAADEDCCNLAWDASCQSAYDLCDGGSVSDNVESFEGDFPPACWTMVDNDADGEEWFSYGSDVPGNPLYEVAQDGFFTAASASWFGGSALNPDNFLITPQLLLGDNEEITYWVAGQDPDWSAEHYGVFLSTTGNNVADFTINLFEETLADNTWLQRTIDLSDYAGQEVYIAFRHFNVSDQFYFKLDNVALPGSIIPCDEVPSEECVEFTTGIWSDFNTEFGGAPANDGTGCPFYEITDFEIWMSEAYVLDNVVEGTSYTFSHCNGPNAGSWIPEYTIIAPSGAIDAYGAGDGTGCSITWVATESGTYTIGINEAGNCGEGAEVENGHPAITCNDTSTSIDETETVQIGIFPNPNEGRFAITYQGEGGLAEVEVLEVSGKVIHHQVVNLGREAVVDVHLSNAATGMYFVRISVNEKITISKVVVR